MDADVITARRRLAAATEGLNAALALVEDALRGLDLGVPLETALAGGARLGWRKLDREWCLTYHQLGAKEPCRLQHAARHIRVEAAGALGQLLSAAARRLDETAVEVEGARQHALDAAAGFRALVPGGGSNV